MARLGIVRDIARGWRDPAGLVRAKLDQGEGAALAAVMGACGLLFVAQWPRLAREAYLNPEVPQDMRIGGALLGIVFVLPLILYALAAISQLVTRAAGRPVSGLAARVALFWAMLCLTPLLLLHGLGAGFLGQGAAVSLLGLLVLIGFFYLWLRMLAGVRE